MVDGAARIKGRATPGRRRLVAGWVLASLGAATTALWLASMWVETTWSRGAWCLQSAHGGLSLYIERPEMASALRFERLELDPTWWIGPVGRRTGSTSTRTFVQLRLGWAAGYHLLSIVPGAFDAWGFEVLLYPVAAGVTLPGVALLRSGRRARGRALRGVCGQCGYDLTGLGGGVACPECGKAASEER